MTACRLCSAPTQFAWRKQLLQKYEISFYRCGQCESLQSEAPYWLDEAYGGARSIPDLAAAARLRWLFPLAYAVSRTMPLAADAAVLDFGGGDGMLVRMLRDAGINAYLADKYAGNRYAVGFSAGSGLSPQLVFAFEVWEHFSQPRQEIEELFALQPRALFISTGLYASQDENWNYLTPLSGRHVFFYSMKARRYIAEKYGYSLLAHNSFALFYRGQLPAVRKAILGFLIRSQGSGLLRRLGAFIPVSPLLEKDRADARRIVEAGGAGTINWP